MSSLLLAFFLIIKEFWPKSLVKYFPLYWHASLFFCLPFTSMSICLFSSFSLEWTIDVILTVFILGALVDWVTYISMLVISFVLSFLMFFAFGESAIIYIDFSSIPMLIYAMMVAILVGAIFSRSKERVLMEKLSTIKALSATIAHEMRTPLSSINAFADGFKKCLPILLQSYEICVKKGFVEPGISKMALKSVNSSPGRLNYICKSSLKTIDMILLQLSDRNWHQYLSLCSMKDIVNSAIQDFVFRENERELIKDIKIEDFKFIGQKELIVHILHNLIKNSLSFIDSEKKGEISIWTKETKWDFQLHFNDTAKGINVEDLAKVFEHGFSKRVGGSGVGLYYCKKMMDAMFGEIEVFSKEGEFCTFVLTFAKAKSKNY